MAQSIVVSDTLYDRLKEEISRRGISTIEELLASQYPGATEIERRQSQVERIHQIRSRVFNAVGKMSDSASCIRADRER